MTIYNSSDIESWERFYRANFINSLTGYKSVSLIGTVDAAGRHNLGAVSYTHLDVYKRQTQALQSVQNQLIDEIGKQLADDIFNKAFVNW